MTAMCKFIVALITTLSSTVLHFRVNRKKLSRYVKILTSLLKVVGTLFWALNDHNVQVYIITYNNFKLYGALLLCKSQKTVAKRQKY